MLPTSASPHLFEGFSMRGQRSSSGETVDEPAFYKYEPILEADEIRLLYLHQGKPGDIIRADIKTVRISESRHYDAISYTWADENGDTTKCCSLRIGPPGLLLPITRSCDSVLRQVRKYTRLIWIDAVCIDQENVRERNHQVDLMSMIYKSASRTFAYVGEASKDSGLVLRNLSEGIWTPPYLLESFFARPYFSRVWVLQEVALSKRVTMMCGDIAVQWTKFMAHETLERIYTSSYFETFPTILRLDQRYLVSSATLFDALLFGRICNASDPRDKVFGLLGMVSTTGRPPANYSMSTAELYTRIAMYLLRVQKLGLDMILGNLCYRSDEARAQTKDLPSWVPDWSQCEPTLLQRFSGVLWFLKAQDPIFEYNDVQGLFFEGQIIGTLETLEEHADVTRIRIHLSNSRSRTSQNLPSVYGDRRVYVFLSRRRDQVFEKGLWYPWRNEEWNDRQDIDLARSIPGLQGFHEEYAFLVSRVNGDDAGTTHFSTQPETRSQEMSKAYRGAEDGSTPLATDVVTRMRAGTELRDGIDGANDFELLGFVDISSKLPLREIAYWWIHPFGGSRRSRQTTYTSKTCTIRIV